MLKPPVDQYSAQGGNSLSRLRVYVVSSARAENEDAHFATYCLEIWMICCHMFLILSFDNDNI